jgi:hypothetical protein
MVWTMLARLPLFVRTYKYLYLGMLVTNLLLIRSHTRIVDLSNRDRLNVYAINVATLGLNIVAWYGYVRRFRWGLISEKALSVGRMVATMLVGPLLLIDIAIYSPVFLIVWNPLLTVSAEVARQSPEWGLLPVWWPISAVLLMAEGLYLWATGAPQAVQGEPE